ncbi:hypothetical protein [Rhizobium sp. BK379]|uniref:hypothetical protein n=1 Tax=Rhizobium sp. BK379 TaxID=2587059 RepID=UPI0013AF804B|nr:hypothetical protein [Rhizobium sp. BK379]
MALLPRRFISVSGLNNRSLCLSVNTLPEKAAKDAQNDAITEISIARLRKSDLQQGEFNLPLEKNRGAL